MRDAMRCGVYAMLKRDRNAIANVARDAQEFNLLQILIAI